jgi:hypothetical protein
MFENRVTIDRRQGLGERLILIHSVFEMAAAAANLATELPRGGRNDRARQVLSRRVQDASLQRENPRGPRSSAAAVYRDATGAGRNTRAVASPAGLSAPSRQLCG